MNMNEDGSMSWCPFMDSGSSICPMGVFEHITMVQSVFAGVTKDAIWAASLLIFLALSGASLLFSCERPNIAYRRYFYLLKSYPLIFNKFLLALSNGLIQPKLYA